MCRSDRTAHQISSHYIKGHLFENSVIIDHIKNRLNQGLPPNCFFWRDKTGHEVDCIIEESEKIKAIEIKSAMTISADDFKGLNYWNQLTPSENYLVYGGQEKQKRTNGTVLSWNQPLDFSA